MNNISAEAIRTLSRHSKFHLAEAAWETSHSKYLQTPHFVGMNIAHRVYLNQLDPEPSAHKGDNTRTTFASLKNWNNCLKQTFIDPWPTGRRICRFTTDSEDSDVSSCQSNRPSFCITREWWKSTCAPKARTQRGCTLLGNEKGPCAYMEHRNFDCPSNFLFVTKEKCQS